MATTIIYLSSLDGNNGFRLDGVATYDFSGLCRIKLFSSKSLIDSIEEKLPRIA